MKLIFILGTVLTIKLLLTLVGASELCDELDGREWYLYCASESAGVQHLKATKFAGMDLAGAPAVDCTPLGVKTGMGYSPCSE